MNDKNPEKASRVMQAMLKMNKIDINLLEQRESRHTAVELLPIMVL